MVADPSDETVRIPSSWAQLRVMANAKCQRTSKNTSKGSPRGAGEYKGERSETGSRDIRLQAGDTDGGSS